jgi:hypothetical protein
MDGTDEKFIQILVRRADKRRPLWKIMCRWEENIKTDL